MHEFDARDRSPEHEWMQREQMGDLYEPITEHQKMAAAIQKVIDDPSVPSVDGLIVRAVGNWTPAEGFRYLMQMSQVGMRPVSPDADSQARARAGAAAGTFGFTIGSAGPGVGALGTYFIEASAGAVFFPMRQLDPIVFTGVGPDEFKIAVREELGLTLDRP
jgi:hypothetical protein